MLSARSAKMSRWLDPRDIIIKISQNCATFSGESEHFGRIICIVPFSGDNFILGCHLLSQSPGSLSLLRYRRYLTWAANKYFSFSSHWFMERLLLVLHYCHYIGYVLLKTSIIQFLLSGLDPPSIVWWDIMSIPGGEMSRTIKMCTVPGIVSSCHLRSLGPLSGSAQSTFVIPETVLKEGGLRTQDRYSRDREQ